MSINFCILITHEAPRTYFSPFFLKHFMSQTCPSTYQPSKLDFLNVLLYFDFLNVLLYFDFSSFYFSFAPKTILKTLNQIELVRFGIGCTLFENQKLNRRTERPPVVWGIKPICLFMFEIY